MEQNGRALRVFVVDDQEVVRRGVRDLVNAAGGLVVVGEAATAAEALARVPAGRPDVAVLDVRLPDGSGVELCRELRSRLPDLECLMLTSYPDEQVMLDAFLAGAAGFVIKDITGLDLIAAVRTVSSGRSLLDPQAAAVLLDRVRTAPPAADPLAELTGSERTTLELIGEGLTNRPDRCADVRGREDREIHVSHVLRKLHLTGRIQIAVLATRIRDQPAGRPGLLTAGRWFGPRRVLPVTRWIALSIPAMAGVASRPRLGLRRPSPVQVWVAGPLPFGGHVPAQVADQHPAAGGHVDRVVGSGDPQDVVQVVELAAIAVGQEGEHCGPLPQEWSLVSMSNHRSHRCTPGRGGGPQRVGRLP
jgi:DNA-binding NarL/FixJ family response regulator